MAKKSHVKVETIRYYERRGLIPIPLRSESGYRQFSQKDVERIRFIKHAQSIGFTLNEISELLSLKVEPDATCGDITQRIDAKLNNIKSKIETLIQMEKTLTNLKRTCKKPNVPSAECPILESLNTEVE